MVTSYASDSYPQGALYYGTTLPSAGSQTLSYSLSGATVDGPNMFIAFFGGTATSSVVQSSGQQTANSTTATTGSMAADSGDLVIAMSPQYDGESCTEGDMISFTGATEQTSNCYNNMRIIPAYAIASGNTTVSITKGEAYQINVLGAIVNKAP
jgi:hypothetical protein